MQLRQLLIFIAFYTVLQGGWIFAVPTEVRDWTSTANTVLRASALRVENGKVIFSKTDGKLIRVDLKKISSEDQELLLKHFRDQIVKGEKESTPQAESSPPKGLPFPLGEFAGPISADDNSSYYIYLPKTMAEGIEPPVVFWTGATKSTSDAVKRFVRAAELTGVAIAVSVESKNQRNAFAINHKHTQDCLKHIKKTLPIDTHRTIFTGGSGGGATAFYNADRLKCAGALPYQAYVPDGSKINRKIFYHIGTGARDFNRYASAFAALKGKDRALCRAYTGGHASAREPEAFEGLLWVYSRHVYEKPTQYSEEIRLFEKRLEPWLKKLSEEKPHRAYFWTHHFLETCQLKDSNEGVRKMLQSLHTKLGTDTASQRYLESYNAMARFCLDVYASVYRTAKKSLTDHNTPEIEEAAKALGDRFSDVSEIAKIARELGMPTVK